MKKLVLTGAAGRLADQLRQPLSEICEELVTTDIVPLAGDTHPNETFVQADLGDLDAMVSLLEGATMVVHFGAICSEAPFDDILHSNIIGAYNIWEAAHRNNVSRVVYASSIHAVGMYRTDDFVGIEEPHRPDSYYGLSKCFAEDLARMFWEKRQIESVCLRIFACAPVTNIRGVGAWLSYPDLVHLVKRAIDAPTVGFSIIYGISNNDRVPVDNARAMFLGFRPKDNGEEFAEEIFAKCPPLDPLDPADACIGGQFVTGELGVPLGAPKIDD